MCTDSVGKFYLYISRSIVVYPFCGRIRSSVDGVLLRSSSIFCAIVCMLSFRFRFRPACLYIETPFGVYVRCLLSPFSFHVGEQGVLNLVLRACTFCLPLSCVVDPVGGEGVIFCVSSLSCRAGFACGTVLLLYDPCGRVCKLRFDVVRWLLRAAFD